MHFDYLSTCKLFFIYVVILISDRFCSEGRKACVKKEEMKDKVGDREKSERKNKNTSRIKEDRSSRRDDLVRKEKYDRRNYKMTDKNRRSYDTASDFSEDNDERYDDERYGDERLKLPALKPNGDRALVSDSASGSVEDPEYDNSDEYDHENRYDSGQSDNEKVVRRKLETLSLQSHDLSNSNTPRSYRARSDSYGKSKHEEIAKRRVKIKEKHKKDENHDIHEVEKEETQEKRSKQHDWRDEKDHNSKRHKTTKAKEKETKPEKVGFVCSVSFSFIY